MARKTDEHGEYETDAGSPYPVEKEDVGYEPCNAVLKYTWSRYGERRYCTGMAVGNFGDAANYEHPDFCKHHQVRASLMKQHAENFKTGAYSKSHKHTFEHLPPHKQIMANDLYKSLLGESTYDFDTEEMEMEIDVSDEDFAPDVDTLVLDHPVPTERVVRGKALWHAALDFVTMESIRQEQFRVAAEELGPDGEPLAIGERTKVVAVSDDGYETEDKDEHHLNLPLSRIQKDYERHMKFGGVEYEADENDGGMGQREWVAVVEPEPEPEATTTETGFESIEPPEEEG